MVVINEEQIQKISKEVKKISINSRHMNRPFLRTEGEKEKKIAAYFIGVVICHQTHKLIHVDKNLIGWQYIEAVFTKGIGSNMPMLSLSYFLDKDVEVIAKDLEKLFVHSNDDQTTVLENALGRAILLKETIMQLHAFGYSSFTEFMDQFLLYDQIQVATYYSTLNKLIAFNDPYKKKSTLLLKLLIQSELYDIDDYEALEPMMDYHMQRLLLRTGCLHIKDKAFLQALSQRKKLSDDKLVREKAIDCIKMISRASNHSILDLDDIFWSIGRSCCHDKLLCVDHGCSKSPCTFSQLTNVQNHTKCIFDDVCLGKKIESYRKLWEPNVVTTHY